VLQQDRERDRGILGAVHRPRQPLLAAIELAGIEVEPGAGRREADDDTAAAAASPAQREPGRLRSADGVERVVGTLGKQLAWCA
jgi:hypothetical protein